MAVIRAACLSCGRKLELGPQVKKGGWVACPHCGVGLEVVSLNPPMLTWASHRLKPKRTPTWDLRKDVEDW